jgi:hypothetical protein
MCQLPADGVDSKYHLPVLTAIVPKALTHVLGLDAVRLPLDNVTVADCAYVGLNVA